jgi:ABC-2 type transport system ATP-binding protein
MSDVERMASRVVMIHEGRLLIDCPIDDLREAHCLALVPFGDDGARERLAASESCLAVRRRPEALHAIFGLDPERCGALLRDELGIAGARCATIALEEMFVELVGGES